MTLIDCVINLAVFGGLAALMFFGGMAIVLKVIEPDYEGPRTLEKDLDYIERFMAGLTE